MEKEESITQHGWFFSDAGCLLSSAITNSFMCPESSFLGRGCQVDCELWRSVLFLCMSNGGVVYTGDENHSLLGLPRI